MKKGALLILACALFAGHRASAESPSPQLPPVASLGAAAPLAVLPAMAAMPGMTACEANSPMLRLPSPSESVTPAFKRPLCGVCSQAICQGAPIGQVCGESGMFELFCSDQGTTCTQDGLTHCACTIGPPN